MELELKSQQNTDGYTSCFCDHPATLLVEIGPIEQEHGSFIDICDKDECLEKAFEVCVQRILSYKSKNQILIPDEMIEYRESA